MPLLIGPVCLNSQSRFEEPVRPGRYRYAKPANATNLLINEDTQCTTPTDRQRPETLAQDARRPHDVAISRPLVARPTVACRPTVHER